MNKIKQYFDKGISSIVVVAIIIIVGVVATGGILAYIYFWQLVENTNQQQLAEKNNIAGWKMYRNDQYGFEFQYPIEGTKVIEERSNMINLEFPISQTGTNLLTKRFLVIVHQIEDCDWAYGTYLEEIEIDNIIFKKWIGEEKIVEVDDMQTSEYRVIYMTKRNNKCLELNYSLRGERYSLKPEFSPAEDMKLLEQIISTFKLFDPPKLLVKNIGDFDLEEVAVRLGIFNPENGQEMNDPQYIDLDGDGEEDAIFTISSGGTAGNFGPFILKMEEDELVELKIETNESFFEDASDSCGGAAYVIIKNRLIRYFSLIHEAGTDYIYIGARYILYKLDEVNSKFIVDKVVDLGYDEYFREKYEDINCKGGLEEAIKQFGLD